MNVWLSLQHNLYEKSVANFERNNTAFKQFNRISEIVTV